MLLLGFSVVCLSFRFSGMGGWVELEVWCEGGAKERVGGRWCALFVRPGDRGWTSCSSERVASRWAERRSGGVRAWIGYFSFLYVGDVGEYVGDVGE